MKLNWMRWTAKILLILFIIFMSIFSFDAESFLGWIMHMIPSFVLIIFTIVAWKWEKVGSIIFIIIGIIFTIFFNTYREIISFFLISFPLFVVGILLFMSSLQDKKQKIKKKKPKKKTG